MSKAPREKPKIKRLKKYRLDRGLSIYGLADKLGVKSSTVSYWENGQKYPRHELICRLEDFFNRPYRDLFTDLTDEEAVEVLRTQNSSRH